MLKPAATSSIPKLHDKKVLVSIRSSIYQYFFFHTGDAGKLLKRIAGK